MIKIIKYFFEAFFIYLFFLIAKLIGLKLGRYFFSFIFKNIGPLFKSRKTINENFKKFDVNISCNTKKKIISNMWSNFGMTFVEYIFLKKFRQSNEHINIKNEEILKTISKEKKPVIFVSGHFANFELMSMEITKQNINLATIYRPLNNIFLNPLMEFLRKKYICKNQIKKGRTGVKECIKYLEKNHSIALMIDQRVSEGEKIKFFNHHALTTTLPAQLAIKYDLDIVPIFIKRINYHTFDITINKPIKFSKSIDKIEISQKLNLVLENMISKNPGQWIWTHNRWK